MLTDFEDPFGSPPAAVRASKPQPVIPTVPSTQETRNA